MKFTNAFQKSEAVRTTHETKQPQTNPDLEQAVLFVGVVGEGTEDVYSIIPTTALTGTDNRQNNVLFRDGPQLYLTQRRQADKHFRAFCATGSCIKQTGFKQNLIVLMQKKKKKSLLIKILNNV